MSIGAEHLAGGVVIGIGATVVMDLWNLLLKRAFGIPSLNYCLLGRWLCHLSTGVLRHANIAAAAPKPFECVLGRVAHYTIGLVFGAVFVMLAPDDWLARPRLMPALVYGIATVVFPFFIMQPSFGLGIAASKTECPARARLKSLMSHTAFGVGLYACAVALSCILGGCGESQ